MREQGEKNSRAITRASHARSESSRRSRSQDSGSTTTSFYEEDVPVVNSDSRRNTHTFEMHSLLRESFSDAFGNPSDSSLDWANMRGWGRGCQMSFAKETDQKEDDDGHVSPNVSPKAYRQLEAPRIREEEEEEEIVHKRGSGDLQGSGPVAVTVHESNEEASGGAQAHGDDAATKPNSVTMERMRYERPEDPRNLIINVIISSAPGTVTLQSIHDALQWDEQFQEANGSVLDYLQGYHSIFAVSPIDDRVTLRRPLQTAKGRRTVRGQRGYHAISSRVGSISYSYVAAAFDLDILFAIYKRRGYEVELIFGVLHVSSQHVFDLFLFSNGVVVWWGMNRPDHWLVEDDFLSSSHSYVREAVKERHEQKIIDEMLPFWCSYELDEQYDSSTPSRREEALRRFATNLCFDHYLIPFVDPIRTQIMLTVSYSLGRTAVVDVFDYITQTLHKRVLAIPSNIRGLHDYFSTRRKITHLEGELQCARMAIMVLHDTPEFLWEMAWLDEYYALAESQNASGQLLSWFLAKSDALLQQLASIKTRRFRLFMLGSDVFLILLLIVDVFFLMSAFVLQLYFPLEEVETQL